MLARRKAIAGAGSEPDGRFSGLTSGFARRSGDFALPDIFRAQRSLRSIRLELGVATIGILAANHADCADILPKCGNAGDVEMKPVEAAVSAAKKPRREMHATRVPPQFQLFVQTDLYGRTR